MNFYRLNILLLFIILISKFNSVHSVEIKIIAHVNNEIITNEDLKNEKVILSYLFNNEINQKKLDNIALNNLVEEKIKFLEIKNKNFLISESEVSNLLKIVLKNNNKSFEDFKKILIDNVYENHLKKKIQIEVSWNKLVFNKFSNFININTDEINSLLSSKGLGKQEVNKIILDEKNKKIQSMSEAYFNEIKNKLLIKYQ